MRIAVVGHEGQTYPVLTVEKYTVLFGETVMQMKIGVKGKETTAAFLPEEVIIRQ